MTLKWSLYLLLAGWGMLIIGLILLTLGIASNTPFNILAFFLFVVSVVIGRKA